MCTASYNYIIHIRHRSKLTLYFQRTLHIAYFYQSAGDVVIFSGNGIFNIHKTHSGRSHFIWISIYLNFSFGSAYNFRTGYFTQFFYLILHFIGILLQLHTIIIAADVDKHDGHFAKCKFLYVGLTGKVGRQICLRLINRIFYFLLGKLCFHIGIKLYYNQTIICLRNTLNFFHLGTTDAFQLFFNGTGYQVFNIFW